MSVQRRPDGKWRARVYVDGREVTKHWRTKAEAERWEREQRAAKDRGLWVDPTDQTTLTEYAKQWVTARPYRASTRRNVDSMIKHHIEGTPLGSRRLAVIRPSEVQAWATGRAVVMSPLRLRNLVTMVRSMFTDAVLDRLVAANPVARVSLPSWHQERIVPLTVAEVVKIADAIPARCRAMVIVQAACGLRIGELLALRTQDVDFMRRTLRVEHQIPPGSRERAEPKTPTSKRTIPLPEVAAHALTRHMQKYPGGEDGSIFLTGRGTVWRSDYYGAQVFKAAVMRAKLPETITPHDLRHHFASTLLGAGEDVVTVANRMGHRDARTVIVVYAHMIAGKDERTRKAIDDAWSLGSSTDTGQATGS